MIVGVCVSGGKGLSMSPPQTQGTGRDPVIPPKNGPRRRTTKGDLIKAVDMEEQKACNLLKEKKALEARVEHLKALAAKCETMLDTCKHSQNCLSQGCQQAFALDPDLAQNLPESLSPPSLYVCDSPPLFSSQDSPPGVITQRRPAVDQEYHVPQAIGGRMTVGSNNGQTQPFSEIDCHYLGKIDQLLQKSPPRDACDVKEWLASHVSFPQIDASWSSGDSESRKLSDASDNVDLADYRSQGIGFSFDSDDSEQIQSSQESENSFGSPNSQIQYCPMMSDSSYASKQDSYSSNYIAFAPDALPKRHDHSNSYVNPTDSPDSNVACYGSESSPYSPGLNESSYNPETPDSGIPVSPVSGFEENFSSSQTSNLSDQPQNQTTFGSLYPTCYCSEVSDSQKEATFGQSSSNFSDSQNEVISTVQDFLQTHQGNIPHVNGGPPDKYVMILIDSGVLSQEEREANLRTPEPKSSPMPTQMIPARCGNPQNVYPTLPGNIVPRTPQSHNPLRNRKRKIINESCRIKKSETNTEVLKPNDESTGIKEETEVLKSDDESTGIKKSQGETEVPRSADESTGIKKSEEATTILKSDDESTGIKKSEEETTILKSDDESTGIKKKSEEETTILKSDDESTGIKKNSEEETEVIVPEESLGIKNEKTTRTEDTGKGVTDSLDTVTPDKRLVTETDAPGMSGESCISNLLQGLSIQDKQSEGVISPAGASDCKPGAKNATEDSVLEIDGKDSGATNSQRLKAENTINTRNAGLETVTSLADSVWETHRHDPQATENQSIKVETALSTNNDASHTVTPEKSEQPQQKGKSSELVTLFQELEIADAHSEKTGHVGGTRTCSSI